MRRSTIAAALMLVGCSSVAGSSVFKVSPPEDTGTTPDDASVDAGVEAETSTYSDASSDITDSTLSWPDTRCAILTEGCDGYGAAVDAPPYTGPKLYVSNNIKYVSSWNTGYTYGTYISSDQIGALVGDTILAGALPYDPDGIYFVFTSADVFVDGTGFCGYYCGWHNSEDISITDGGTKHVRYSFVGDTHACSFGTGFMSNSCAPFDGYKPAPNGDWSADGMTTIIAHELAEAATDPDPLTVPGWKDTWGWEVGDKCAWDYGDIYSTSVSAPYNVEFGGRPWLIQQMWELNGTASDHCSIDFDGGPGFSVSEAGTPTDLDGGYQAELWTPMRYLGGKVMSNPINVYFIWYGDWSEAGTKVSSILQDFINGIGTSTWWSIVTQYYLEPHPSDASAD